MNAQLDPAQLPDDQLSAELRGNFANSRKVHVTGSRADLRVPMREISQARTPKQFGAELNPPVTVYDTSGPYTDPTVDIDLKLGLPPLRAAWIAERGERFERPDRSERGERPERAPKRMPALESGMERFRLEVGYRHGVKPANIVGAIANEAGVNSRDIGRIEIFDTHALIDLPEGMPKELYKHLQKVWVSGQHLRIQRVDASGEPAEGAAPRPRAPHRPGPRKPR